MANEKRLIDANAFYNRLRNTVYDIAENDDFGHLQLGYSLDIIAEVLKQTKTVETVEVVRCKDCKNGIWDEEEQMWECVLTVDLTGDPDTYSMFHEYNDGEHFCSYGERKGEGK